VDKGPGSNLRELSRTQRKDIPGPKLSKAARPENATTGLRVREKVVNGFG